MTLQGRRASENKTMPALIAQLLQARAQDLPLSDEDIRRLGAEGRP